MDQTESCSGRARSVAARRGAGATRALVGAASTRHFNCSLPRPCGYKIVVGAQASLHSDDHYDRPPAPKPPAKRWAAAGAAQASRSCIPGTRTPTVHVLQNKGQSMDREETAKKPIPCKAATQKESRSTTPSCHARALGCLAPVRLAATGLPPNSLLRQPPAPALQPLAAD